jgi:hypothetical protein
MARPRNWYAIAGLLFGLGGIVAYFALILTHDPSLHRRLEWPVFNLLSIGVGLLLSCVGAYRALRRAHRGVILAPLAALLNFAFAGFFSWWLFLYSFQLPPAAAAPAVGAVAPDFALMDEKGHPVTLSSFRGKPLVLLFYRGFW